MFHSDYEGTGQKDILLVFTLGTNLDCKKAHIQSLPAFPSRLKTLCSFARTDDTWAC